MASDQEKRVVLNPLDYIPPHNYVRLLYPLEFKPDVDQDTVWEDLIEALHKTLIQEPWLSGKVYRQDKGAPGWRPGQLEIRYPTTYHSLSGARPSRNLRRQQLEDYGLTFAEFRDAGFPSGIFPEDELLVAPRIGDVDSPDGADVFLGQANFLPGGVLIGMTTFHAAIDAAAMLSATGLWAENFRELRDRDAGGRIAPSPFATRDYDRTLPDQIWERETAATAKKVGHSNGQTNGINDTDKTDFSASGDPWLRSLVGLDYPQRPKPVDDPRTDTKPPRHPQRMLNRIMFLSSTDLAALHKHCTASHPAPAGASSLSVSDTINALYWRCVLRARQAAARARGVQLDSESVFESPVDVRQAFGADFPPDYLGNCFLLNNARMPLSDLIAPDLTVPLGQVAHLLRAGAARLDDGGATVRRAYGLLRGAAELGSVQGRFVERAESADLLLSNVIFFPLEKACFGGRYFVDGGTPATLRVLHGEYAPYVRLGHVLPKSAVHGGVEISLNLFDDEMVFLDQDEEWNRFVVPVDA